MLRIVVTGGRHYADKDFLWDVLDELHAKTEISFVVTDACVYGGADAWAEQWAKDNEVSYAGIPAKFSTEGRKAGPLRNAKMLDMVKPDIVLAFPGGSGTASCVKEAIQRGIEVRKYE